MQPLITRGYPLVVLLGLDISLILVHVANTLFNLEVDWLSIENEHTVAEAYQLFKLTLCLLIILIIVFKKQCDSRLVMSAWLLLFGMLALDDWLGLHERAGQLFAAIFDFSGSEGNAIGELLYMIGSGFMLICIILFASVVSDYADSRFSLSVFLLLIVMSLFAVGIDYLHASTEHPVLHPVLGLIEEGGELFSWSLLSWYIALCWYRYPPPTPAVILRTSALLWDQLRTGNSRS